MEYPNSRKVNLIETIHGVEVSDPYRWLEDIDSAETRAWISAQNKLTSAYLEQLSGRERLKKRLHQLWDFEKFDAPVQRGSRLFFSHNNGLQNQPVLFWQEGLEGEQRELLDPNNLSADGTMALVGYVPSPDGKLFAYGISASGSDWMVWKIRNVETGEDLDDLLEWVKFSSVSWTKDSKGFFYSRYDAPESQTQDIKSTNYYQQLYFHQVGEVQAKDELIHSDSGHKEWGFNGDVSEDGRYLVITVWQGTHRENAILYRDLSKPNDAVQDLLTGFDASYLCLGNLDDLFYFETDCDAPMGRIIAIKLSQPGKEHWKEIVAESGDAIQYSTWVGNQLFIARLHHAVNKITCYNLNGSLLNELDLPGDGMVPAFLGPAGAEARVAFYTFTNFFTPLEVCKYDLAKQTTEIYRKPKVSFNPDDFQMEQVFYTSKDGTQVPMFICHRRDLVMDGKAPTYLYGYGGFNIAYVPNFMVSALLWMEIGGIFALANIRGGGEYGKAWHEAGTKHQKQNVFNDFMSAAEWLVEHHYTTRSRIAIGGRSNGGLLIGACLTQRPDLFGATLPIVGVLDMIRFHKFTIGWAWVSDYGSPDVAEEFPSLYAYSPYHNIRSGEAYPPTLICTGDHDDRVFPAHSFKFAAALQSAQAGPAPVLIRIDEKAGHGVGKPTAKLIEELADQWAFLAHALDFEIK